MKPKILPDTLPIGTKFILLGDFYEFISIASKYESLDILGVIYSGYKGDVKNCKTNIITLKTRTHSSCISWDSYNILCSNEIKEEPKKQEKKCFWCKDPLESYQKTPYCEYSNKYCKEYYKVLKERLALDFRQPEEALEHDIESVRRFVNNYLRIK